jgi:serine/threonine-protein kinase RsbT
MPIPSAPCIEIEVKYPTDPQCCQVEAKRYAREAGFTSVDATMIGITVTELAANQLKHAGGGTILLRYLADPPGIEVEARDSGPGIADVRSALRDGFSRGQDISDPETFNPALRKSLGCGLGVVERLMDSFEVSTLVGWGTTVVARKWLR